MFSPSSPPREWGAPALVRFLERGGGTSKPARLDEIFLAGECDARGRLGYEDAPYPQRARINAALAAVQSVVTSSIAAQAAAQRLQGAKGGGRIHAARVRAVADWLGTASTH